MNRLFAATLLIAAALLPASAMAQISVGTTAGQTQMDRIIPALAKVGQFTVVEPSLANAQASADCSLDIKAMQAGIEKILTDEKLPVVAAGVGLDRTELLRVTVRPDIATLKDGVVNCVSYVSLKAEVSSNIALPPLTEKKTLTPALWTRGGLILTPVIDHPAGVNNAFGILARGLVKQYRLDNPDAVVPVTADPLAGLKK